MYTTAAVDHVKNDRCYRILNFEARIKSLILRKKLTFVGKNILFIIINLIWLCKLSYYICNICIYVLYTYNNYILKITFFWGLFSRGFSFQLPQIHCRPLSSSYLRNCFLEVSLEHVNKTLSKTLSDSIQK